VTDWAVIWLGVIAVSVATMTVLQWAAVLAATRLARETSQTLREFRREIQPLIEKAHRIADEAARTTSLAALQVERLDSFVRATTDRVDETFGLLQGAIIGPLRRGSWVLAAAKAALAMFNARASRRAHSREEEDALFVG
jgi:hypothetical protein